ncbi:SGNH family lipase [Luedemannella flava]|uniref:SGNH family lipase n=1 Tax=Luedemannella flava TaxID=349316 RepID=A0ABP4YKT6_9ACTN
MRTRLLSAACVLTAALTVLLPGSPASAAAPVDYVALGDSYSSGTGAPPYSSNVFCLRSPRGYPQLWANTHAVSSFRYVACGGATTASMTGQFSALSAATDLVTITIGGNDVGFADTMLSCVLNTSSACVSAVDAGIAKANNELPAKLDATYATIRDRAPNATVLVLGYPRLIDPGSSCYTATKVAALTKGADALNAVIAARAAAAGLRFVDARARFAGHGACASSRWINQFSALALAESFHPNATGYAQGYLYLVNTVTG